MTSLAEIKAAAKFAKHPEVSGMVIPIADVDWLVERCEALEAACRRAGHGRGEGPDDCHICLALARLEGE